jgi:hypothetical protein
MRLERGTEMKPPRISPKTRALAAAALFLLFSGYGIAAEMITYRDPTHGFSITHPGAFVVRAQDVTALPQTAIRPIASIFFMNPVMAGGGLAGREPPDLEVRVYDASGADSLPAWLSSSPLASADAVAAAEPYRIGPLAGLKVCRQDMLAPGCAIFLMHARRIFQLTAISAAGERMIDSFTLISP